MSKSASKKLHLEGNGTHVKWQLRRYLVRCYNTTILAWGRGPYPPARRAGPVPRDVDLLDQPLLPMSSSACLSFDATIDPATHMCVHVDTTAPRGGTRGRGALGQHAPTCQAGSGLATTTQLRTPVSRRLTPRSKPGKVCVGWVGSRRHAAAITPAARQVRTSYFRDWASHCRRPGRRGKWKTVACVLRPASAAT